MIPFFIYYSMFGFQRIGDLLWAAGDMRCRGFVLGGTAGRTTLAGEGLQHQDGNSHLNALAFPNCQAYDPCYAYEMAVIVLDGAAADVLRGGGRLLLHHADERELRDADPADGLDRRHLPRHLPALVARSSGRSRPKVQLFGSGAILRESLRARSLLEQHFGVGSDVYSVTSYKIALLRRPRVRPLEPPAPAGAAATAVRRAGVAKANRARSWRRWITSAPSGCRSRRG